MLYQKTCSDTVINIIQNIQACENVNSETLLPAVLGLFRQHHQTSGLHMIKQWYSSET